MHEQDKITTTKLKKGIEFIIFRVRWMLIPFYVKLFYTLARLLYAFYEGHVSMELQLQTLEDIDIVMIANLVKMVITGSYNSFVSKDHGFSNENNSSGILKVKTMTSLMGICAIALLKSFLEVGKVSSDDLTKQLFIFGFFTLAAWALAKIDYIHVKGEALEHVEMCAPTDEKCEHK